MQSTSSSEYIQHPFSESHWYGALTLAERIASLRASDNVPIPSQEDRLKQATRRLDQWKKQFTQSAPEHFDERLAEDEITEQELLMLLAEPLEQLQKRVEEHGRPEWISDLQPMWENYASSHGNESLPDAQAETMSESSELRDVFSPLVYLGSDLLSQGLTRIQPTSQLLPSDTASVRDLFLPHLLLSLQQVTLRTLILELHVARLEERLSGDTPKERFSNFLQQLRQPAQLYALLREYPLMTRSLLTIIHHWADYSLEIIQHLCADWDDICRTFAVKADPGNLVEVQIGAGDTHRRGRSVAILRFHSGWQLVYKPRSLSLDQHFQEVLAWVNTLGIAQPLRPLAILNKRTHGWAEFVQVQDCAAQEEVSRFYERQGSYLALLYALDAADFHHQNILAAGEHPLLVDLEALFHSRPEESDPAAKGSIKHPIGYSVLRTGLLPSRTRVEEGKAGIDISGLGGQEGQFLPRPVPTWKESGTDQMHLQPEPYEIPSGWNRPKLPGQNIDIINYSSVILKGFTEMYRLLVRHREEWLDVILPRFEHDEVRIILRHTQTYATLLSESSHPDRQREAFACERLFDHLWDDVPYQSHLRQVIHAERKDLWRGDVPLFVTQPASKDLFTSQGESIPDFCSEPGMEFVKRRIKEMDERDLALQQWVIQASLVTTIMGDARTPSVTFPPLSSRPATCEQLIQAASAIGTRLDALAIRGEWGKNWLGIGVVTDTQRGAIWQVTPGSSTLYDGLPGIILFLSYLGKITGESRYLDLANLALLALDGQIDRSKFYRVTQHIGGFSGLGSLVYLFSHLSVLHGEDAFLERARQFVEEIEPLIEQDKRFDMINGAAGCISSLLAFYQVAPSPRTLEVVTRCGEHLLANAHSIAGGLGWYPFQDKVAPAGFAHGVAGIALSLFQLAQASRQERFFEAAQAALTYERSLFSEEQGNWRRFLEPGKYDFPVTWCYGASGIGLARLACLPYLDNEQIRQEIHIALTTTLQKGFGHNHSLCHGDLGNLEVLLAATQTSGNSAYQEEITRLATLILGSTQDQGWVTGVPLGVETPGLMNGLAGMGYQLLRLAEPERVPSVLQLAPPFA